MPSSPLDILRQLYPQARVTSTARDPNSALGRANPRSYHNVGQAFDVAPLKGVGFNDYVQGLKGAGVNVVEALDEATHPKAWTTGPNWHIAYGDAPAMMAPRKPKTLADLARPPLSTPPINDTQPMNLGQPPMTLADLGSLNLPEVPEKKKSPFTAANILGVLGDALMAYGGLQPQFGPGLQKQREQDQEANLARERLAAMVQLQREKAMEPPQFAQNAQWFLRQDPSVQRQILSYEDATNPINVSTPQGTQNVPRTTVKNIGGKTYYNIGGEWYEEGE